MLRNERGLSTIIGLVLIGLMLAGMAVGIQSIKNPAILRSRATDALNLVNQKPPQPSPSSITQEINTLADLPENCDENRTICFSTNEAEVRVYRGGNEDTTSTGEIYYIAPAFKLVKNGASQDFKLTSIMPEGTMFDPVEGRVDGGENIQVRIKKGSEADKAGGLEAEVNLWIKQPGRPAYIDTNYKMKFFVTILEAPVSSR